MPRESRRTFMARGAAGVAALGTSARSLRAASGEIVAAVIGCGTRGAGALLPNFRAVEGVRIAAVCDVFKPSLEKAAAAAGPQTEAYGDYRRVLERKDIDVVAVATPDHWHGPITVAACEAGKDVYVEKPLSNSISDCLKMVEAARKHNRVVQVGLQQRSSLPFQEAYKIVQSGALGRIRQVCVINPTGNPPGGLPRPAAADRAAGQGPPEGLDWEMFQGPAPRRPYSAIRQRSWRDFWEYGAGTLSDWGVHVLDVAHWYLGVTKPPATAAAAYAWLNRPNDGRTPDTVDVVWRYDSFVASYSSRGDEIGTYLYGDQAVLHVNRNGYSLRPVSGGVGPDGQLLEARKVPLRDEGPASRPLAETDTGKHVRNFLECVRTRQRPVADVETGATSTIPTLMGALSIMNQGKCIQWEDNSARPL